PTGHEPSLAVLDRLALLYQCSVVDLLADLADYRHLDDSTRPRSRTPHPMLVAVPPDRDIGVHPAAELPWPQSIDDQKDDIMERRWLLGWAAASLGAGALGASPAEPAHQLLADLLLANRQRSLEDWEITCADHLHAIRTRPPAQVRDDLLVDLAAVHHQLTTTTTTSGQSVELHRILAMLAALHGNALTRLGEHGPAIAWWRTARHAADLSGDLHLRLHTRGQEAVFGLYGQRDPQTVLQLTRRARQLAGTTPSAALARLPSTEAKAPAVLGRDAEAQQALNTLTDLSAADATAPGPSYWTSEQVHFAESWVYASAGDEAAAAHAAQLLSGTQEYQYSANIQLHQALCTIVN